MDWGTLFYFYSITLQVVGAFDKGQIWAIDVVTSWTGHRSITGWILKVVQHLKTLFHELLMINQPTDC